MLINGLRVFWIERITEDDEVKAKRIIRDFNDKDFSYTDAVSFVIMERLNIYIAFALDEHFVQYGRFLVLPLHREELNNESASSACCC